MYEIVFIAILSITFTFYFSTNDSIRIVVFFIFFISRISGLSNVQILVFKLDLFLFLWDICRGENDVRNFMCWKLLALKLEQSMIAAVRCFFSFDQRFMV